METPDLLMEWGESHKEAEVVHLRRIDVEETFCNRTDAEALRHAYTLDATIAGTATVTCDACSEVLRSRNPFR